MHSQTQTTAGKPARPRARRRRKSAPPALRLLKYLGKWSAAGGGCWKPCPSYRDLATRLRLSVDTISRAFRALEDDPACPLAFASDYDGPGRTRRKLFALRTWLKYDARPLLRRADGSARGTRPSFRRGVSAYRQPEQTPPAAPEKTGPGNSDFCTAGYIKKKDYVSGFRQTTTARTPSGLSKSANALAWRHAREALADGELFYDNRKPVMPLASLRALLLPAFQRGMSWARTIRPALKFALQEAHNAAVLAERAVKNPGGMAAVIFRERLGFRRVTRRQLPGRPVTSAAPRRAENLKRVSVSAPPVDKDAVRAQFAALAAAMRAGLVSP